MTLQPGVMGIVSAGGVKLTKDAHSPLKTRFPRLQHPVLHSAAVTQTQLTLTFTPPHYASMQHLGIAGLSWAAGGLGSVALALQLKRVPSNSCAGAA